MSRAYSSFSPSRATSNDHRAANISTFFFISYVGATAPIIAVGLLADRLGLPTAVLAFCGVTAVLLLALVRSSARLHPGNASS